MSTAAPTSSTDLVGQLLTHALDGAFDSFKGKVTTDIQENGEKYLHQAVEKIKESTSGLVAWAKENPMKTAAALAALAAVSAIIVHTMASPEPKPAASGATKGSAGSKSSTGRKTAATHAS